MQAAVETVTVDDSVSRYCVSLAAATRRHPHVLVGASPRGSLALLLTARAVAVIAGRDYVTPEDVKAVAIASLAHRITVKPELWMSAASGATVVDDVLSSVPVPAALEGGTVRSASPAGAGHDQLRGRPITAPWRATVAHLRAGARRHCCSRSAAVGARPPRLSSSSASPLLAWRRGRSLRRPVRQPTFAAALDHHDASRGSRPPRGGRLADAATASTGSRSRSVTDPAWTRRPRYGAMVVAARAVATSPRRERRSSSPADAGDDADRPGRDRRRERVGRVPQRPDRARAGRADDVAAAGGVRQPGPAATPASASSDRITPAASADGAEFATIRPFAVGDRLRRIHWPVSLRTGELHVSASLVDVDTQIVLVVDASNDVGEHGGLDGPASSLDRSVRAAGALAEHFLRRGDRVGLRNAGAGPSIRLPAAGGQRHLRRLLFELALIKPGIDRQGQPRLLGIPAGAMVVVLTPLLSTAVVEYVVTLRRAHFTVLVVDTLPDEIVAQARTTTEALAWRVRLLQRDAKIRGLATEGVPTVPWRGPGSLDAVLRDLRRSSAAPRMAAR